jgi:hypothetical protein
MIVPEFVKDFCREQFRRKGFIRVAVDSYRDKEFTSFVKSTGLNFDYDLCFHGTEGVTISLDSYINRVLTYAPHHVKIMINGVLLTNIRQKALPPPAKTPELIDLTNT